MQHAVDVHEIKSIFIHSKQQQEWKIVTHTQAQIQTILFHTHIVTLWYVYFHYAGMAFLQLNKAKNCFIYFFFIPTVSLLLSLRHSTLCFIFFYWNYWFLWLYCLILNLIAVPFLFTSILHINCFQMKSYVCTK